MAWWRRWAQGLVLDGLDPGLFAGIKQTVDRLQFKGWKLKGVR